VVEEKHINLPKDKPPDLRVEKKRETKLKRRGEKVRAEKI
jgi:hypothetical protein